VPKSASGGKVSFHAAVKMQLKPARAGTVSESDDDPCRVSPAARSQILTAKFQFTMETTMSKRFALFATAALLAFGAVAATPSLAQMAEKTVNVGGAPMYPSKNIIQNAVNSKDPHHARGRREGRRPRKDS
jgi:hypothetical protein